MSRRVVPVLIAVILIVVVAVLAIKMKGKDEDAYGTEEMDLRTYFDVTEDQRVIFIQNERMADKAIYKDNTCYLNYNFVKSFLNTQFYYDRTEKKLLLTDANGTFCATPGETKYLRYGEEKSMDSAPCSIENEILYVSLPYVAMLSDVDYRVNEYRLQFITSYDPYDAALVNKNTKIRCDGDANSAILCDAIAGETLAVLEYMEPWSHVQNDDGIDGYVETKFLGTSLSIAPEKPDGKKEYEVPEYVANQLSEKVCLGWHAIGGVGGNATLADALLNAQGMNVISPTWFSLNDNEGGFRSFAEASYVQQAHKYGLEVWGAFDDFNYELESGEDVDDTAILSSTSKRWNLISNMIAVTKEVGMDGINLDFEKVGAECSEHFGQFLRELSVECRKNDIKLSIDNYMPNEGNKQYRLDVQGQVVDYVILMGYDEHWHGSGNPGSVASIGFVTDGITKALSDVPAGKLVNAVPLYTIQWTIEGADVKDAYIAMINEEEFLSRVGIAPVWDEQTCQNYIEWSSNGKTFKVWLEDLDSISVKLNVMSANDLAGVAAWRLGYGTPEVWKLLSAFKKM
ncbi:MAG: chitinase [Lachnospiraceae bacterium]|nr:chitinase [Lachnospiraceae bacterium]